MFVFGDFNIHRKDWLNYSGGTDRLGELCYNFSVSNDLTEIVNFPTRISDCDLCLSSDARICFTTAFPPLRNYDHLISQFPLTSNSKQDAPFQCIVCDYSHADWDGPCDHLRDVLWKNIFKLVLLLLQK